MKKEEWSGGIVGVASFQPLEPKNENGVNYLPIEYTFPMGKDQTLNDNSALVRPLKGLLDEGNIFRRINFIFYKEKDEYYTIGSIVVGKKYLIFYPALMPTKVTESAPDKKIINEIPLNIDHITLEENWDNWHFTFKEKKEKGKYKLTKRKTKKVNDSVTLWFVMAVQSLDKLERMPKTQEYKLTYPKFDELERRYSEFIKVREDVRMPIIEIKGEASEKDWYLNLEFFLSEKKSENYQEDYVERPTVYGGNHVSSNQGKPIFGLRSKEVHVHLPGFDGRLWVRASRMPGILEKEGYFFPGTDYK